jgi:hypothetical protein
MPAILNRMSKKLADRPEERVSWKNSISIPYAKGISADRNK